MFRFGISCAATAFGIAGACTFPDPATEDPSGSSSGPTSASVAGSSSSGTVATSTSSSSSTAGAGGDATSSSTSTAGGGGASSSSGDGAGGTGSSGGEGGTLVGVGGGVTDIACDNGCVPFPSQGGGGSGGAGGHGGAADDDCDDDGDPNLEDCQPCNEDVFHGQPDFFGTPFDPFEPDEAPSFDYDCSGGVQYEYPADEDGCGAFTAEACPEDVPVFTSNDIVCGQSANLQDCEVSGSLVGIAGSCVNDGAPSGQTVRCH